MAHPISRNKSLIEFCYRLESLDPIQIAELACAEAYHHRQAHMAATGTRGFRSGSAGRRYCDDLQRLVTILVQGEVPPRTSPEFMASVGPLIRRVTGAGWQVGRLAEAFAGPS